eukprot:365087_1
MSSHCDRFCDGRNDDSEDCMLHDSCNHGASCNYLSNGECWFYHPQSHYLSTSIVNGSNQFDTDSNEEDIDNDDNSTSIISTNSENQSIDEKNEQGNGTDEKETDEKQTEHLTNSRYKDIQKELNRRKGTELNGMKWDDLCILEAELFEALQRVRRKKNKLYLQNTNCVIWSYLI